MDNKNFNISPNLKLSLKFVLKIPKMYCTSPLQEGNSLRFLISKVTALIEYLDLMQNSHANNSRIIHAYEVYYNTNTVYKKLHNRKIAFVLYEYIIYVNIV